MTPYGDSDLGQHWLRQWLVAWRHQAITWTNVDLSSVRLSDIHLRASSQEIPQPSITEFIWKIKDLKFHSDFPGANELNQFSVTWVNLVIIMSAESSWSTWMYWAIKIHSAFFCLYFSMVIFHSVLRDIFNNILCTPFQNEMPFYQYRNSYYKK